MFRNLGKVAFVAILAFSQMPVANAYPNELIYTNCTWPQINLAIHMVDPSVGAQLDGSPMAQSMIQAFANSGVAERVATLDQAVALGAASFVDVAIAAANICSTL